MSNNEMTAVAILRAGRSYDEASKVTGINVLELIALYKRQGLK